MGPSEPATQQPLATPLASACPASSPDPAEAAGPSRGGSQRSSSGRRRPRGYFDGRQWGVLGLGLLVLAAVARPGQAGISLRPANANQHQHQQQGPGALSSSKPGGGGGISEQELWARPRGGGKGQGKGKRNGVVVRSYGAESATSVCGRLTARRSLLPSFESLLTPPHQSITNPESRPRPPQNKQRNK
jgi:hypothetical protein